MSWHINQHILKILSIVYHLHTSLFFQHFNLFYEAWNFCAQLLLWIIHKNSLICTSFNYSNAKYNLKTTKKPNSHFITSIGAQIIFIQCVSIDLLYFWKQSMNCKEVLKDINFQIIQNDLKRNLVDLSHLNAQILLKAIE